MSMIHWAWCNKKGTQEGIGRFRSGQSTANYKIDKDVKTKKYVDSDSCSSSPFESVELPALAVT